MSWRTELLEPLRIRISRMTTEENEASGSSDVHQGTQGTVGYANRSVFVQPDRFCGYPSDDVIDWFASFERIARANEWDMTKCGRMVSAYLRGPAGDHFEKIPDEQKSSFAAIKKSLIERFSPADMRRSAYSTLTARKQGQQESVNEFASAIQRLVFRSFPCDASNEILEMTAREHFILGLRPKLMNRVTMADPKTFSDAIRIALREESLAEHHIPGNIHAVQPQNQQQLQNEQMVEVIGLLNKLLKVNDSDDAKFKGRYKSNKSANGRSVCNFCGKPGHFERKCWQKFPHLKLKGRKNPSDVEKDQGN